MEKLRNDVVITMKIFALTALIEYYGDASLIWAKMRNEFESSFANGTQVWGEYGDSSRVSAIARVIEFLRQSHYLTTEFKQLRSEVYSSTTFALLKKILPGDYIEKVNDTVTDVTASAEQKIKSIKEFLEKKKVSALMGVSNLKGSEKINESGDDDSA